MASLRAPGLAGFLAQRELAEKEQAGELQQAQAVMGIQGALEQRRQRAKLQEVLNASGGDPEKAIPALIQAGDVQTAKALSQIVEQKRRAALPQPGQSIGAGGLKMPDGTIIPPAARPDTAPRVAPTRKIEMGDQIVTLEQQPDGSWKQIAKAPRWQPPAPEKPAALPKPKVGYRWNADGTEQERIPGGPVDVKFKADLAQARKSVGLAMQSMESLGSDIRELKQDPGLPRITGTLMGRTPNLTNTATGAQAKLDSIKSKVFVAALQSMREASKTGGAVGQVTEREGDKLERTLAALDQAQGTPDFQNQLDKALQQLDVSMTLIRNAYKEQFGEEWQSPTPATPTPPALSGGPTEGQTATNPKTGQRIVFKGGKWQPM